MSDCIYLKIEDMSDWNSEAMGGHGDKKCICMKTGREIPGSHIRCTHCKERIETGESNNE